MRRIVFVFLISALLFIVGCGGGSKSSNSSSSGAAGSNTVVTSGNNVAPLIVDGGPSSVANSSNRDFNMAFTTVVLCVPTTSNCVTIDHVLVDTGSTGLRIPYGAFATLPNGSTVLAALKNVNPSAPVAECYQFVSSFNWGTVRSADVKMGGATNTGEVASSVPILVTGDPSVNVPPDCTGTETDTVALTGANGLIGVNFLQYDCDALGYGNACTSSSTAPPGMYYTCSDKSCTDSPAPSVPVTQQVRNPVAAFATDNNGVILEMPAVPVGGQSGIAAGQASLVFGIGTQSNNALGSVVVLTIDPNATDAAYDGMTTVFNGVSYPDAKALYSSFIDSGSNGIFFPDPSIPTCNDWYCPTNSPDKLTAQNQSYNGNSDTVQFNVSNADVLFSANSGNSTAFSDLAGPTTDLTASTEDGFFDWGLPFFYGRNVATAIWGVTPPSGVTAGPFWAY